VITPRGSPGYLAPELFSSEKVIANPSSDMWSLGAIIYSLLFRNETPFLDIHREIIANHSVVGSSDLVMDIDTQNDVMRDQEIDTSQPNEQLPEILSEEDTLEYRMERLKTIIEEIRIQLMNQQVCNPYNEIYEIDASLLSRHPSHRLNAQQVITKVREILKKLRKCSEDLTVIRK
jgi:serine/threonine protein kinase